MYGNGDTRRKLYPGLRAFIFFPRADLFAAPEIRHFSKLPYRQLCLASNRIETNFSTFFPARRLQRTREIVDHRCLRWIVFCFFFFFSPSLRDKTTSISVELNTLGWQRDWNWNNSKTTCIPLIPLGGNQNGKFGNKIWRIIDEREREKRKRASRKNFLEGRERDAEWSNTTTIMKFPRKLINRDIRPLNSRVVSHLRTINYMMERWSIRESVQSPSKVKFFSPPFEAIAFDRTELDHRLLKSIRSNEFNLKSWTQAIQFESLFVPLRMTIPNINSKWYLIIFLLWNEDIFSFYCWFFKFRFFLFEKKKF